MVVDVGELVNLKTGLLDSLYTGYLEWLRSSSQASLILVSHSQNQDIPFADTRGTKRSCIYLVWNVHSDTRDIPDMLAPSASDWNLDFLFYIPVQSVSEARMVTKAVRMRF